VNKAYINEISIKSVCGDIDKTFDAMLNKQTSLKVYSEIVPEKEVCIGKFYVNSSFKKLLQNSVEEVLIASNLKDFSSTLLLVGSSVGGMATSEEIFFKENSYKNIDVKKHIVHSIASLLDDKFHFFSTRSFSTACTSSANALKTAKELISIGAYKNILVVGADQICMTTIFGFSSLGILNDEVCTPFQQNRKGMNVAEGIGVLLLQDEKQKNSIELIGAGTSSDAFHIANPDPTAQGAKSAILNALKDASLSPNQIDYINAHGTGTNANDAIEAKAVSEIFPKDIFISSTKPTIGHTLGAAGAIEACICTEVLKKGMLIPQIKQNDYEVALNFVENAKKKNLQYVMSNSFAFGGNNVSLIFGVPCES